MPNQVRNGVLVLCGLLLQSACGTEFQACEGECNTTGGGTSGTTSAGGSGSTGTSGNVSNGGTGTSSVGGASTTGASTSDGGAAGDPGIGGSAGAGGAPPMCDGELLPEDDACVVDEEYAVFVSPTGDDATGEGTRESPFATLQKGADVASDSGKRVYACATGGDYSAGLTLGETHAGLEMYGSFDCADWTIASDLRASVAPETGVPLRVSGIETGLELSGFEFESADATEPGASSIAAEIRGSSGVVLSNVALLAGSGAVGAPGETMPFVYPDKSVLDGVAATEEDEGFMPTVPCPAGDTTRGGPGGITAPGDGSLGTPNHDGPGGEGGSAALSCGSGGTGSDGVNGPAGGEGPGAATVGSLMSGSWTPASGNDGGHGLPGQGGGGGAGATTGGGGSGGAGGCGGAGGAAGGGGGASIALLLVDAGVTLTDSVVAASDGGDGGAGQGGQQGQQESGSSGDGHEDACDGGRGGLGGSGGPGGGGAGGISVGILLQDSTAMQTNTEVTAGTEGDGGEGAGTENDGVPGLVEPERDLTDV